MAQLCEAGEEEFLEIMTLVGMAAKPLHVRRLQKALQEYVMNPGEGDKNYSPLNSVASYGRPLHYYSFLISLLCSNL